MEIQFLGQSCFRIKGKSTILLTDPFNPEFTGLKFPKTSADIITVSHPHEDHNYTIAVAGTTKRTTPFVINEPGEYEMAGVSILGISSFHDNSQGIKRGKNTIFIMEIDGIRLVHLGDLGHKLDESQLEEINGSDLLFIPVGEEFTLDVQKAVEVVNQVAPRIVIPMHYYLPGLKFKLAPVDDFLKEMGAVEIKPVDKLVLSRDNLPEEKEVVVLNARS